MPSYTFYSGVGASRHCTLLTLRGSLRIGPCQSKDIANILEKDPLVDRLVIAELADPYSTYSHEDPKFPYGAHAQIPMFSITHPSFVLSISFPTCQTVSLADCSSWSTELNLSFPTTITIPRPVLNVLANSAC